jgi:hypothetical protein
MSCNPSRRSETAKVCSTELEAVKTWNCLSVVPTVLERGETIFVCAEEVLVYYLEST